MRVKVYRTQASRQAWRQEYRDASVKAGRTPQLAHSDKTYPALLVGFMIDAAGGGATQLMIAVTPDDFDRVASAMMLVNPAATEAAFAAARAQLRPSS